MKRRNFIQQTAIASGGLMLPVASLANTIANATKTKIAMVGTGSRGVGMWGRDVLKRYADNVTFVGLCDTNKGRVETAKQIIGTDCPTFTNFEQMMRQTKPELLIVTTVDATHHEFIIKGMEMGANVITEKPMTTDERKCQAILDAQKRTGKKVMVGFNYRYSPHRQKLYELLRQGAIGDIVSVDFHWYLDIRHGADYFRRWHAFREKSGTLLVHKATHHFDLLNWWLESEPEEVFAYGALEHYGKNNSFRGTNCRTCSHKKECNFYWDITKNEGYMKLYVDNEQHDGYLRDACVFRNDINIYDKMAAQIRYMNGVSVSYSLTTYSPYEGYRIAFNGKKGRLETWIQESSPEKMPEYDELVLTENFGKITRFQISNTEGGHGGGDDRLKDKIFKDPNASDPFRQSAGMRDGAMSILVGIAARNSIEQKKPIRIADLTSLKPMVKRP
jgi:predicted dehydrogenase